jgi:NADH:ubiquinone oxidoreductase subunit 6 (subunit J)
VDILSIGGIFLLTQILAIALALFRFDGSFMQLVLLAVAVGAIGLLLAIVEMVRRESVK